MALEVGSVSIGPGGTPTGSGLALALYNALLAPASPSARALPAISGPISQVSVALATAIIGHLTEHGVVTVSVTPSDAGLQRDPADEAPTLAPVETKTLTGSIA